MQTLKLTKKYDTYPEYKDSGVEWLGKIPKDWRVGKVKEVFNLLKEKSFDNSEADVLSLTLDGIKRRDVSNNEGQIAASYEGYRKIIKGDIVLNPMDLVRGFVDSSKYEGIISPAYSTLRKKNKETDSQFYNYFFQKHYFEGIFHPFGNGVSVDHRWTLKDDTLLNFPIVSCSKDEQIKVSRFIDEKTFLIDQIIEKKQKLIELLREKRTAVINHAVTKGLDSKVELVESGIDWIGKIPKKWKMISLGKILDYEQPRDYISSDIGDEPEIGTTPVLTAGKGFVIGYTKEKNGIFNKKLPVIIFDDFTTGKQLVTFPFKVRSSALKILKNRDENKNIIRYIYGCMEVLDFQTLEHNRHWISMYRHEIIPNPEIQEQLEIGEFLENKEKTFEKIFNSIEKSIEKLQEFKSSLISNVVTGKVRI